MKRAILFFISVVLIFTFTGCGEKTVPENGAVEVIISKDFGNEQLLRKSTGFRIDDSVMEAMVENFEIETAYGGGFVNSINGLKSGFTDTGSKQKLDWFYYINGKLAQVGADDYYLKPNDIVIWDYHDWSSSIYISSIIGAYPNNFLCGYEGNVPKTEIMYEAEFKKETDKLAEYLRRKGLRNLELISLQSGRIEDEDVNTVVVCDYDTVSKIEYIDRILNNSRRASIYFEFSKNIAALNVRGEVSRQVEKGAVITSISKGIGTGASSVWLITGNDKDCIKRAVRILYEEPEEILGRFSVIVTGNELINIPVKD